MYTVVVNMADGETTGDGLQKSNLSKRTRKNGGGSSGANNSQQPGLLSDTEQPTPNDAAEGFTPDWREESEARIQRRREVIVNSNAANHSPPRNYGSVGDSGTHLVDDDEEERNGRNLALNPRNIILKC